MALCVGPKTNDC
uniref:Uncharacterized protein n=1 Tax=Arundo donax TaxID=35708 RepID=A0A0A8ZZN1_ARUDO